MDFIAQIRAVLDTKDAETKLNALTKEKKLTFDIGDLERKINGINGTSIGQTLGKQIGTAIASSIKESIQSAVKNIKIEGAASSTSKASVSAKQEAIWGIYGYDTRKYDAQLASMEAGMKKYGNIVSETMDRARAAMDKYRTSFADLQEMADKVHAVGFEGLSEADIDRIVSSVKTLNKESATAMNSLREMSSTMSPQFSKFFDQFNTGKFGKDLANMEAQMRSYGDQTSTTLEKARADLERYRNSFAELQNIMASGEPISQEKILSVFKELETSGQSFANAMGTVKTEMSKALDPSVALQGQQRVLAFMKSNTAGAKQFGAQLKQLAADYAKCGTEAEKAKLDQQFRSIQLAMQEKGLTGNSIVADMGRAFKNIAQFAGVYRIIMMIPQALKSMVNEVRVVDAELTTIRKITSASDGEISQMFESATKSAKEYGLAISDVIKAQADQIRLGYNMTEAKKLADVTAIFQQVGDNMTQESASTALISSMKGFGLNVESAMHIVDAFNNVADHMPIATDQMAEALSRSASSMHAAGNTMEQTMALITAANSVVQNPERVGTAFQTISMRIRGAKSELEDAGLETEGMLTSVSKLREEVLGLSGVDIMLNEDTFKSTYQILDELSQKWSDLTDIQQASLTELLAGKRGGNIISAIMQNFDIARESLDLGLDSDGVAMKELENYQKGIEYHVGVMKATFQDFSNTAFNSDMIIGFVDALTKVLEVATNLVDVFGNLGGVIASVSVGKGISTLVKEFSTLQDVGSIVSASTNGKFLSWLNPVENVAVDNTKLLEALKATTDIDVAIAALGRTGVASSEYLGLLKDSFPQLTEAEITAKLATTQLTASVSGGGGLLSALKGFVINHHIIAGIAAIGTAFLAVNWIIKQNQKAIEEAKKAATEAVHGFEDQTSGVEDQISKITELRDKLDSGTLSESEAYQAKSELYDIQMSLVDSYGALAEGIDLVNGNLDTQIEKVRALTQEEAQRILTTNQQEYDRAKKELSSSKTVESDMDIYALVGNQDLRSQVIEIAQKYTDKGLSLYSDEVNGVLNYTFKGKPQDLLETINDFLTDINNLDVDTGLTGDLQSLKESLTNNIKDLETSVNEDLEIVQGMDLISLRADNRQYGTENPKMAATWYEEYAKAIDDVNKALSTGEGVDEAYERYSALNEEILNMVSQGGAFSTYAEIFDRLGEGFNKAGYSTYKGAKDIQSYIREFTLNPDIKLNKDTPQNEFIKAIKELSKVEVTDAQIKSLFNPGRGADGGGFVENINEELEPVRDAISRAAKVAVGRGMLSIEGEMDYEEIAPLVSLLKDYGIVASETSDAVASFTDTAENLSERTKTSTKDNKAFAKSMQEIGDAIEKIDSGKEVDALDFLSDDEDRMGTYGRALEEENGKNVLNTDVLRDIAGEQITKQIEENNALISDLTADRGHYLEEIAKLEENYYPDGSPLRKANDDQIAAYRIKAEADESQIAILEAWNNVFSKIDFTGGWAEDYAKVSAETDNVTTSFEKLQSAVSEVQETGTLDFKIFEDDNLKEYMGAFTEVNGQIVVNYDLLKKLTDAKIADTIATNNQTKAEIDAQIAQNNAEIDGMRSSEYAKKYGAEDIVKLEEQNKSLQASSDLIVLMNQGLTQAGDSLDKSVKNTKAWDVALSDAFSSSSDYVSNIKDIDDLVESVKKTGKLDPSVFNDENLRDYASAFTLVNGQATVNEETIRAITEAKKAETKASIDNAKALIAEQKARNEAEITALNELASEEGGEELTAREARIKALEDENAALDASSSALDIYSSAVDNATSKQTGFSDAISNTNDLLKIIDTAKSLIEVANNGDDVDLSVFDSDEMLEYADALEVVNGKLKVNADKVREITRARILQVQNENRAEITRRKAELQANKDAMAEIPDKTSDEYLAYEKANKELERQIFLLEQRNKLLSESSKELTGRDALFADTISSSQNTMAKIDVANGAMESVKAGEVIDFSIFEDEDLRDYADAFRIVNGELTVNERLVNKVSDAKLREQIATNNATKEAIKSQYGYDKLNDIVKENIKILNEAGHTDAERAAAAQQLAAVDRGAIADMEAQMAQLDYTNSTLEASLSTYRKWNQEFDKATSGTDTLMSNLSAVNSMLAGMSTGKSVDYSVFNAEGMLEYADAIEYVNGALQVNRERVREITEEKVKEQVAVNETAKAYAKEQYKSNLATLAELEEKLAKATKGEKEYYDLLKGINTLETANEGIANRVNLIDLYTQSLIESTGAYQGWLDAQSGGSVSDMGDDVISAMEYMDKVFTWDTKDGAKNKEYHAFGDEKYQAAVEFLVPDEVSAEGAKAVESYIKDLKTYFTGNGAGVEKFIDEAINKGLIDCDPDTDSIKIAANKTMEDFANAFNWTPDTIRAMFGEIEYYHPDYGIKYTPNSRHEVFQENRGGADLTLGTGALDNGTTTVSNADKTETKLIINPTLPNGEPFSEDMLNRFLAGNKESLTIRTFFGEDSEQQAQNYSDALDSVYEGYDKTANSQKAAYEVLKDYDAETLRNIDFSKECTDETEDARQAVMSLMDTYGVAAENVQSFIDVLEDLGLVIGDNNQYQAKLQFEVEQAVDKSGMTFQDFVAAANDAETGDDFIKKTFSIEVEGEEGMEQIETYREIINSLNSQEIEPITIKIDQSSIEDLKVIFNPETAEVDNYEPKPKEGEVTFKKDSTIPDNYQPPNPNATVTYTINPLSLAAISAVENQTDIRKTITYSVVTIGNPVFNGSAGDPKPKLANGTAHARGTAFAHGSWAVDHDQTALVGEVDKEIVVI